MSVDDDFRAALQREGAKRGRGFQTWLAARVNVSPQYVFNMLKGNRYGSESIRRRIAEALGYEYEEFLGAGRERVPGAEEARQTQEEPPGIRELLEKTREVLLSGDPVIASALSANIVAFHQSIKNERAAAEGRKRADLNAKALQARIEDLEHKISSGPPRQNTGTEGET